MSLPHIGYGKTITDREREIIRLFVLDRSIKQVAAECGISYHGAHSTINHVYTKLGLNSQVQLLSWAIRDGMVTLEDLMKVEPKGRHHGV